MKSLLLSILFLSSILLSELYAQDIKAKLAGHQATNGFTVVDDDDNVLFKVTGEGDVGIKTNTPSGILDVQGGTSVTGDGRGISIIAETGANSYDYKGGNVLLRGGRGGVGYGDPAQIIVKGGKNGIGGDIEIRSGHGPDEGGDINIISSGSDGMSQSPTSELRVGDINIGTDASNLYGGKITIFTASDNAGGGDIELSTGSSSGDGNKITLRTGTSDGGGGDIILEAGSGGTGTTIVFAIFFVGIAIALTAFAAFGSRVGG